MPKKKIIRAEDITEKDILSLYEEVLPLLYDNPDKVVTTNNNFLFRDMFTIVGLLFVFTIVTIIISFLLCEKVNVGKLLLENKQLPVHITGEEGLKDIRIISAIYQAAKTGKKISLT